MVFLLHISAAHTGLSSFVSPANPGKAEGGKKNKENIQSRVGERERGLGFHWVDWRGFGPLNRSTCSSGISRRRSSILVEWGCLPITP